MHPQKQYLVDKWKSSGLVTDKRILDAFLKVEREHFILGSFMSEVYGDYPLPIPKEQTISQPTTVMIMTQALEPRPGNKILEIGAGSGYQAAILGKAVGSKGHVYTIEVIKELAEFARTNLEKAAVKNVTVIHSDGGLGYEKETPYDRIIVTAACPALPPPLVRQLKVGGIILAPVNHMFDQIMIKGVKQKDGKLEKENLGLFRFVPLIGRHGE